MYNIPEPWGTDILYPNTSNREQTWIVPKRAKMIHIWASAGGGGGGGGCSGSANTLRGGGQAGGAASVGWVLIPTIMCPDVLYVTVGQGGAGGGPDTDGTNGEQTVISQTTKSNADSSASQYYLLALAGQVGGTKGTTSGNSPAGGTGSLIYNLGFSFTSTGLMNPYTGGAGSSGTNAAQVSLYDCIVSPGTGGAGSAATYVAANGGNYFVGWESSSFRSGGAGNATGGGRGIDGTTQWNSHHPGAYMIKAIGGTGGGNANTGNGGNGGNGGIGSGGGGGGAGITGGTGGRGGDGVVIISYW